MVKEFKEFAMKGNVLDLAIGVIIGAAFGKIVTSLVEDILMPPLGLVLGKVDFSQSVFAIARHTGRVVGRSQKSRRAGHRLRQLRESDYQLCDRGVRHLFDRKAGQSLPPRGACAA